jgi:hypothetical protein
MKKLITFLLCTALFAVTANAATYYVNIGLATGANNGSSWTDAYQTWSAFTAAGSPGVVAISRSGAPFVTSAGASWTTGSTAITLSVSNPLIVVGDAISGTGLASNTTVTAISGTTLTLSLATTATVTAGFLADAVADDIYIKGTIPSQSGLWVIGYLDNFYGSCAGTESSPSQRPMYDNDGNGIVESWEFQYPTTFTSTRGGTAINGSSAIFDGFTITHTGAVNGGTSMTTYISPIGQTVQNCVFTGSSLSYGATTAYTNGNGGCLLKVLGTFKNNLIEKNNVSLTYVTTSTSSTDIKVVPYLEVNFPATNNIVVSVSGCIFRNNVATISNSGTAGTTDNLRGMVLTTNHPNTAGLTGTSATFSDCIIHNNEISYTGTIMPGKSSIAGSLVLSSSSSKDNFINCTFANNKMTNIATCFYATSTGNVIHKVYNNALWNNKNTVSSTNTTSTVSMYSQSAQNASTVFNNNYVDVTTSGNWSVGWGAGNVTNFSASNTGSNGPYFKKPPMNGANNIIGAFQSAGTELTSINLSDWRLNPGTYLNGKGITTTILKDKAGIDFSSTPSVGAYEYVKVTPTVTINVSSYIYNGSNQGPNSSTIGGTIGGVNSTGILTYINSESGNSTLPINAGNYTVTATLTADTYYNSVSSSATSFSLSKKPLTIGAPSIASKTYDGSATSGTVIPGSLSGFVDPETVSVSSAIGTYPDANVGTGKSATIVYTLANGTGGLAANYSLANGSASGDITAASGSPTGDNLNNSGLTDNQLANTNLTISSGEFIINDTKAVQSLTVAPGAKLTHSSGTLTATNGITLESDATGTATLMDSYTEPTINATLKQYVTAGRNWYMSAPLNNSADYSVLNKGNSVAEYNETTGLWPAVSSGTLTRGKGYVQIASSTQGTTGTVSFNGITNSGDVPVTLTYTSDKGKGFNLVGNPYPSFLSWSAVAADNSAANMPTGTMWYRTISYNEKNAWAPSTTYSLNAIVYNGTRFYKVTTAGTSAASGGPSGGGTVIGDGSVVWNYEGSVYVFATISASGVASPATVSNLVPPTQAFWVKSTGGTLTFKNTMRTHNTGAANTLKAPKNASNDIKLLRLNVTNGASADEAVIYASNDASNAFDTYDAPKYFNTAGSNQPEIYTQVGNEKLVINAMNEITTGTEIPLGFATEKGNDFTISASEFRNLGSDIQVVLKDKQTTTEFDLISGQSYAFSSDVVNNTDRFSLIFRTSGSTNGVDNTTKLNAQVFVNTANQIVIVAPEKSSFGIYNAIGMMIENGITTLNYQTSNIKLQTGVYVVKVNNQSTRVVAP